MEVFNYVETYTITNIEVEHSKERSSIRMIVRADDGSLETYCFHNLSKEQANVISSQFELGGILRKTTSFANQ